MKPFLENSAVNVSRRILTSLALTLPLAAAAVSDNASAQDARVVIPAPAIPTTLIDKVRDATARYVDINAATHDGWVAATPCVSGPEDGAMGVHLVKPSRLSDGVLKAAEPEALIYEPQTDGSMRLVGVEFIALASTVQAAPQLEGHLFNYVGEPNRYGLPAFYELHVWAWENNPKGTFADWNTRVSCDRQPSA